MATQLESPNLEWADLDDRARLARAYGEAWVAALPARDETFGLVLAEALACGTPVVGYDHAAIPEVIDQAGIGGLFDSPEPEALATSAKPPSSWVSTRRRPSAAGPGEGAVGRQVYGAICGPL